MGKVTGFKDSGTVFKLAKGEEEMLQELLKTTRHWQGNVCLTDTMLETLLNAVALRCTEILERKSGFIAD